MKKLSNIKPELKKTVAYKKKRVWLKIILDHTKITFIECQGIKMSDKDFSLRWVFDFSENREIIRLESEPWVSRQNGLTWHVWEYHIYFSVWQIFNNSLWRYSIFLDSIKLLFLGCIWKFRLWNKLIVLIVVVVQLSKASSTVIVISLTVCPCNLRIDSKKLCCHDPRSL